MTEFVKYMHIERFGNDEVQGIELGNCYVFPKLDGTNASVWIDRAGSIQAGSRNRHLSIDADNAGFFAFAANDEKLRDYLSAYPHHRLYGEWLVPHSLKTYREEAWRRFYVFDVHDGERYLPYDEYAATLDSFGLDYLAPSCVIKNGTYENFLRELEKNVFLIKDGAGVGEGIVLKNYEFKNRFGNVVWAKMVTTAFKEQNSKVFGPSLLKGAQMVEQEIVDKYVTRHLVDKVVAKISSECEGWNSKYIPRLLQTVFHDLVTEETWAAIKEFKNPTINFKTLGTLCTLKIKELKPEIF